MVWKVISVTEQTKGRFAKMKQEMHLVKGRGVLEDEAINELLDLWEQANINITKTLKAVPQ